MFYQSGYNSGVTTYTLTGLDDWNTSRVTSMYQMFYMAGRYATTWSIGNISGWTNENVTTMYGMFYYAGNSATNFTSIGTLNVHSNSIYYLFYYAKNTKAIVNIYNNPGTYTYAFTGASTVSGSLITVNYSSTTTNIDNIIGTKSATSNVVKGVQLN